MVHRRGAVHQFHVEGTSLVAGGARPAGRRRAAVSSERALSSVITARSAGAELARPRPATFGMLLGG